MNNTSHYVWVFILLLVVLAGYQEYRLENVEKLALMPQVAAPVAQGTQTTAQPAVATPYTAKDFSDSQKNITGEVVSIASGSFVMQANVPDVSVFSGDKNFHGVVPTVRKQFKVSFDSSTTISGAGDKKIVPYVVVQVEARDAFLEKTATVDTIPVQAKTITVLSSTVTPTQSAPAAQ